ncbi:MAG: hypothetical protein Q8L48_08980 [Archangium sp.]|nr:hypothetical protein [Archangium sp.]
MNPTGKTGRGPLFWGLVIGGVGLAACCLFTMLAVVVMGAFGAASDLDPPTATGGGGPWIPAGEVARSATLTQQLPGGRWVYQSGGSVDTVVARAGATAWVQTNTSGSLYAFTFEGDGSYTFEWASAVTLYGGTSRSSCVEKGDWSLDGNQLTLEPRSQRATYVASAGLKQDKEDVDLSARTYEVVDIELEGIVPAGAPPGRFPGIELKGRGAPFDVSRESYELDLQRL